jgi:hypothetical protein
LRSQRLRRKCALGDAFRNLRVRQFEADPRIELIGRHTLRREELHVSIGINTAIGTAQLRDRGDIEQRLLDGRIGHRQIFTTRLVGRDALLNEAVDQTRTHGVGIEHLRIEARAEHLAHTVKLLALCGVELLHRDLASVHARHVSAIVKETAEPLNAHQPQPREDEQRKEHLHQTLMVTDEIQHGLPMGSSEKRRFYRTRTSKMANPPTGIPPIRGQPSRCWDQRTISP